MNIWNEVNQKKAAKQKATQIRRLKKELEFIKALIRVAEPLGFCTAAIYAQAHLETDGFKKVIGKHNYWGIKKPKRWKGKTHKRPTIEVIKGKRKRVTGIFIDFATVNEAIRWYIGLIERLYPQAYTMRKHAADFVRGLIGKKFKWATDPIYVKKVLARYYSFIKG